MTNRCAGFYAFTRRAEIIRSRRPFRLFFGSRGRGSKPRNRSGKGAPSVSLRTRAGARSLRLAQRVISGFVEALDFAAVEALIPDLQVRAEGFGRA
jgi:hypothetical protein